ncbi:MAG: energy-coupling factor transporter transmembrane component T [Bacilli bacterium]|nr:energy-coupling factor transporter transmembrane component T [Bacilli bacterium]
MSDFSCHHPLSLFSYFTVVIIATLLIPHPIILLLSGFFSCFYAVYKQPAKTVWSTVIFVLPVMLFITLTNAVFANQGETVLFTIGKINVTLEEIYYGASLSIMFISVLYWFRFMNNIFSNDKFLYIFSKIIPRTAFVLSLSLKSIPVFRKKAEKIKEAQLGLGFNKEQGIVARFRSGKRIFLGLLSWSLENAIDTATAMRARGYGLKPRSFYSRYRFQAADVGLTGFIIAFIMIFGYGKYSGRLDFIYYPCLGVIGFDWITVLIYCFCGLFYAWPLISEIKEIKRWRNLKFAT